MSRNIKHVIQSLVLLFAMLAIATNSDADPLSSSLSSHFSGQNGLKFIDYEVIEQAHADEYGSMRYLVMDFDLAQVTLDEQSSIHNICSKVLNDHTLLRTLSNAGYDMIAVSFDQQSQYDCL